MSNHHDNYQGPGAPNFQPWNAEPAAPLQWPKKPPCDCRDVHASCTELDCPYRGLRGNKD